jgi:hypothetical protein
MNILIRGNEPTFVISNRKEVIDLTLGPNIQGKLIRDWPVSYKPSLSAHKRILQ